MTNDNERLSGMVEPGTMDDLTPWAVMTLNRTTYVLYLSGLITSLQLIVFTIIQNE